MMKNWTIASTLVTLSLGALASACGSAETSLGSDMPGLETTDPTLELDQNEAALTACDDNQYDHWRYLAALGVASAKELGRWAATKDFVWSNDELQLSATGLARCKNGCDNIKSILLLQKPEAAIIPRHDPGLMRSKLAAFYQRQQTIDSNNGGAIAHDLTPTTISSASCGYRYWFKDTVKKLGGSTPMKSALSGKCIDTSSLNDGAGFLQATCDNSNDQKIVIEPGVGAGYRLKQTATGRCMRARDTAQGSQLELRTCDGNNNQLFDVIDYGSGKFALKNLYTNLCLDVSGASTAENAKIIQWGCQNSTNQMFNMTVTTTEMALPSTEQAKMKQMLTFVGADENPYLMFQSTATEVSIDPMGTMVDGGSSGQSNACLEGSAFVDTTGAIKGKCCETGGKYGIITVSPLKPTVYYCKL
jgi:hypothetical protein